MDKAIKKLQNNLKKASSKETKDWFEAYLKYAIEYRGVKTPIVEKLLSKWRREESIDELPLPDQLRIAGRLIEQKYAEDKFAGIIYIQKYLLKHVSAAALLDEFERLFSKKVFCDWSTTDWFTVRVLDDLIVNQGKETAARIASWSSACYLWQKRCSIVAFRGASRDSRYHSMIERVIKDLVSEQERFIQTGIGWTIAEMSRHHPSVAARLVEKYFDMFSAEVIRRHTKHLPCHKAYLSRIRQRNDDT